MSFKWKGAGKVKGQMMKRAKKINEEIIQSTKMEGEAIMNVSQTLVPRDTGWLAASKSVLLKRVAGGVKVELEYDADYAWFVHEINKNYVVGQWKYLETAMKRAQSGFAKRVADRARSKIGR